MLYFAAFYSGGINSDISVTYSDRLDDRRNTHFFAALCLSYSGGLDRRNRLFNCLILFYCFPPPSFHFPSNSKKEKTHTLFHSLSLSKSPDLSSSETHCYPPNSPEIELDGDPNHLKPPPISSKRLSFYLALFLQWVCLKFQIFLLGSCGFVCFFFQKIDCGFGFDF